MELMTPAQRDKLLGTVERDAFHLELRDHYQADDENAPIRRWLDSEPDDYQWLEPWLERVRAAAAAGRSYAASGS